MKYKTLDYKKNYKVSGTILSMILDLQALYQNDCCGTTPFCREKIDYTIGMLVNEFANSEWEEV